MIKGLMCKAGRAWTVEPQEMFGESLMDVYKCLKGGWKENRARLISGMSSDRTACTKGSTGGSV